MKRPLIERDYRYQPIPEPVKEHPLIEFVKRVRELLFSKNPEI